MPDPNTMLAGDTQVSIETNSGRELQDFYAATYARLVRVVGAVSCDRQEAEDAVMDAFVRLMPVWPRISSYGDPEAWVRKVALGVAANRRRKVRNGLRAAMRLGPPIDAPGPTGEAVDVSRAVATLSRSRREVIVLHHVGLDAQSIADELHIPLGTVKSRLARARAELTQLLREDLTDHV